MDSSSSIPNDPSKNSKKRVFSEKSSDSNVVDQSSKSKALKMKEVANQEIIYIDSDDESGNPTAAEAPVPSNNFLSGSQVHNASKAFSVNEYGFNVESSEILKKLEQFKNFDIVQDPSDHHYVSNGTSAKKPSKNWSKRIQEEWKILEKDLPDTILVRAYESRMDLLRAVIVGADGTPYHDGLFFFDVFFPDHYPYVPPHVYYHSGGLKVNPNLKTDGKICLSLLNTWHGSQEEMWIPEKSTMLQVLVSIQGLILNANPFYNEAGFYHPGDQPNWEVFSQSYNEKTFKKSLKTMLFTLQKQPMHFEDFVVGHFFKRARDILVACKAYTEGAQVGCLVRGGIQDVDEGDKSCSWDLRTTLPEYIKWLVDAFTEIGVKGCQQFVPPAETGTSTINYFR